LIIQFGTVTKGYCQRNRLATIRANLEPGLPEIGVAFLSRQFTAAL